MSRRHALRQLTDVLAIRAAQRFATEAQLKRAQDVLSDRLDAQQGASEVLTETQAAWSARTNDPVLSLPIARVWASAVILAEADLGRVDGQVQAAERAKAERLDAHRAAEARQDAAKALAKAVRRRLARKADDIQAAIYEDRPQPDRCPG